MRLAIVSDIHANLQAWKAVLLDIGSSRVDRIICLGDIVGYGPNPADVLESVYEHAHHVVLGNHDAAVCGKIDEDLFNDAAAGVVRWTRTQLNPEALRFLNGLPLTLSGDNFRCSHGDFAAPAAFNYVIDPADAAPSWNAVDEPLLFVGHSHDPAIFVLGESGTPHRVPAQDFSLEPGKRFLVNVGSVGSPRDGDARASYCIYDTDESSIYWRRIPFDLDAYRQCLERVGIDATGSYFLQHDPLQKTPSVRDQLSFRPPANRAEQARDVVEVAEISLLHRAVTRWKRIAALAGVGTVLILGLAAGIAYRVLTRTLTITPACFESIEATAPSDTINLLHVPEHSAGTPETIPGWKIVLEDRRQQRVQWNTSASTPCFILDADGKSTALRVASPAIETAAGMRFCLQAMFRLAPGMDGTIGTDVTLWKAGNGSSVTRVDHFAGKPPNMKRTGGWLLAKETFEIPAGGTHFTAALAGSFTGTIEVKDITLTRIE
jgi:predicted phosphodiesterase